MHGWPEFVPEVQTPHPPFTWQLPPVPQKEAGEFCVQIWPGVGPPTQRGTQALPRFGPDSQTESGKHWFGAPPQAAKIGATVPAVVPWQGRPLFGPRTQRYDGATEVAPSWLPQKAVE